MPIIKNFIFRISHQLIILLLLAFGLNINTLFNDYAMDDSTAMLDNVLVHKGIKGIPEIVSHDLFSGDTDVNQSGLSGGRYRPVTLVIFAMEYQFFGKNPMADHLINILFFALLIVLLFKILHDYIFRDQNKYSAFLTCLLFTVHPIHTEVIANIKSLDEILAFILLIASLNALIQHAEKNAVPKLIAGLLFFFLALLTKETAVTFIGILPLVLYFFFNRSIKKAILFSIPLVAVFMVYILLRFSIIGYSTYVKPEIINSPYLFASVSQAFATKIYVLLKYVSLLFFPHPLSSDYSYNQIPYINIASFQFILSILILASLVAYAIYTFKRKSIYSFAIIYFFITIFLFTNFLINLGAPLADRFLFQPSLAYCIVIAGIYLHFAEKYKLPASIILLVILLFFSVKTISRNADWKNNETLCLADVISSPNSVKTNLIAANIYITKARSESNEGLKEEYLKKAIKYDEQVLKIYPQYLNSDLYGNLGLAYFLKKDYFKAADNWLMASRSDSTISASTRMLSDIMFKEGIKFHKIGNFDEAVRYYKKSVELNEKNVEAWYNLGGNYFLLNDIKNGVAAWQNVLILDPRHPLNKNEF